MKKAIIYAVSVCLVSWGIFYGLSALLGDAFTGSAIFMQLFKSIYMFFPLLVAFAIQLINKESITSTGLLRIKLSWSWAFAIAAVIVAVGLSIPFSAIIPGVQMHYGAEQYIAISGLEGPTADALRSQLENMPASVLLGSTVVSGIIAGCTINALFAFGEEYGWRNYLVSCLKGQKFIVAALFIGIVWGIWHFPLVLQGHNYPQHPIAGVPMMCVFCVLVGIIELYFVLKTKSAVIAAVIHGCVNAMAGVTLMCIQGGNDLTVGFTGVGGGLAIATVCLAIYVYDKRISRDNIMSSEISF